MSKKITSFLTLLLALFFSVNTFAQTDEFENKSVTVGGAVTTIEPDTWYLMFNGSRPNEMGRFLNADESPTAGGVLYDAGAGQNALKKSVLDIPNAGVAANYKQYYVRFVDASGDGESDVYQIQFATGNYLAADRTTIANKYDSGKFNVYTIDPQDPGKFGFNLYNMGSLVNNNGTNAILAYWKSGQITTTDYDTLVGNDTYNSVWNILEINFADIDPIDAAWAEAGTIIEQYSAYLDGLKANVGTNPGQ